jgi:hypothetical protein
MKKTIHLLILVFFSAQLAKAQEIIVTDRPDQTESSLTIPHKSFQIESGFGFSFTNKTTSLSTPNTLFRYGLFSFLELRFYNEVLIEKYSAAKKASGISDVQFGIKLQLFEKEDKPTSVGFLSHVIAPSGSIAFSNKAWGNTSRLLVTHQFTDQTALGVNLGYTYLNSKKGDLVYTASLAHSVTARFGVFAEVFGDWVEFDEINVNGDAGFTYLIKPNLQLDASYGIGFTSKMNFLGMGVSWNISPKPLPSSPTNE